MYGGLTLKPESRGERSSELIKMLVELIINIFKFNGLLND